MSEQSKKLKQIDSVSNDNQPSTNQLNANPHQISHHVNTKQIQKQNKYKSNNLSICRLQQLNAKTTSQCF